jgi:hypothetical protein
MRSILLKGFGYARLLGSQPNKVSADSPEINEAGSPSKVFE